jgi:hypothetical protein
MKKRVSALFLAFALAPGLALAQTTPTTFAGLANQIVKILGSATVDLIVLAIVVYFWGVSTSLFKEGEKGHEKLREQLIWGVVVIFLAVSIWGVVQLLQTTVFGAGAVGKSSSGGTSQGCSSFLNCNLQ